MLSHELARALLRRRNNNIVVGDDQRVVGGVTYDSDSDQVVIILKPNVGSIDDLNLTEDERRFLAMHATYEAQKQYDARYQEANLIKRAELRNRWQTIADTLHEDPWGKDE